MSNEILLNKFFNGLKSLTKFVMFYTLLKKYTFSFGFNNSELLKSNQKTKEYLTGSLFLGYKFYSDDSEDLIYSCVIIKDPNSNKKYIRFVSAVEGEWVRDKKQGVYHRIPENHIWVVPLNDNEFDIEKSSDGEWSYVSKLLFKLI